jgi:hypothetical protein
MNDVSTTHDKFAPYWAAALVIFAVTGIATVWIDLGAFWKGYALDIVGPAWNYILFRGLFTSEADNAWTRFFTPLRTLIIFIAVCIGIEVSQFFNLYDATYDPWDFVAYLSLLLPVFILDFILNRKL